MGADHDEVGRPRGSLLDDDVRGASCEALDAERLDADSRGGGVLPGLGQELLALLAQLRQDRVQVGRAGLETGHEDELVEDVEQAEAASGQAGDGDRFGETPVSGRTAVDRNEDSLVHGMFLVLAPRMRPVWRAACRRP